MRKFFLFAVVITATSITLLNCTKGKKEQALLNPENLNSDTAFSKFTLETYDYLQFLAVSMKSSGLGATEIGNRLQLINTDKVSYSAQLDSIDAIYKTRVSGRVIDHMKAYNSWLSIKSRYSEISIKTLENEMFEVLKKELGSPSVNGREQNAVYGCGWRYYLCSAAALAAAAICHGGCTAGTGGLGLPACVVACSTVQASAMVYCSDTYCSPSVFGK